MRLYEYAVIRIVPRIEREEFVNVGLIMMCKRHKWLRVELLPDTDRLRAISGKTDTAPMLKQLDVFKVVSAGAGAFADMPVEERFRWLTAVKAPVYRPRALTPDAPPTLKPHSQDFLKNL